MKLKILERIAIEKLCNPDYVYERLKVRFEYLSWSMAQSLAQRVYIAPEEAVLIELQITNEALTWNTEKDPLKEFDFSLPEREFLTSLLKSLSDAKQIDNESGELYRIFVIGGLDGSNNC